MGGEETSEAVPLCVYGDFVIANQRKESLAICIPIHVLATMKINPPLVTKDQLAKLLGLKRRGVECLVAKRKIPVLRLSSRCVRFRVASVMRALERFEQREIGREK